jgi:superfamily II DNA or RNA helicase
MSIVTAWSPFFQSQMRMRGRAYQLAGRVTRVEPGEGELVRAQVQGRQLYTVVLRQDGRAAVAECTCPSFSEGAYCKHIWATLLDLQQAEGQGPGAAVDRVATLRVRAPKARKRDEGEVAVRAAAEPEWMGRLSLLRSPTSVVEDRSQELLPLQREVCYVVLPQASQRHGGLVVEFRQRTPTLTGWSKPKALRVAREVADSLADPIDRELCGLLLGGTAVDHFGLGDALRERGHGMLRVPSTVQRTLLQRMIGTGRCYLDADEEAGPGSEVPLVWDDAEPLGPWVLWMVGTEVSAGGAGVSAGSDFDELQVHVELRRAHEKLAIDEPHMILGGPDGVVLWGRRAAPFDDRGASRWVAQFRGDRRGGGSASARGPMRGPRAEADRFIDRLYMLPALPEIDLPDSFTRNELQVRPQPHLELFSPDSRKAADYGGSATLKHQLVAGVWFDYAGQRVSPLQAGRFITVTDEPAGTRNGEPGHTDHADTPDTAPDTAPDAAVDSAATSEPDLDTGEDPGVIDALEGDDDYRPSDPAPPPPQTRLIRRDHRAEREAFATLSSVGFRQAASSSVETLLLHQRQMPRAVADLIARGWVVSADQRVMRRPGAPTLSVASGIDWFELRGTVSYERGDGARQDVSLPDILAAVRAGENMIVLGDGSVGLLPEQWLDEHGLLTALGKLQSDHLRFKSTQAALLDAMLRDNELVDVDEPFRQARERLRQFKGITPIDPHPTFRGTLRPYQREGLGWLAFLRWFGMGGILADDMGLGKTVQVLAMLQMRKLRDATASEQGETPQPHAPSLIVAPRSLIFNWLDEAERFTPGLRAVAYSGGGTDRDALRQRFDDVDIVVTSYGLLRRDIEPLREQRFDYVVLDEAQAIKNPNAQAAKAARLLQARHRLALTGTPVENHLGDLWSIFEFLNPGMLGSSTRFGDLVRATPSGDQGMQPQGNSNSNSGGGGNGNGHAREQTMSQVAAALRPFILRRTKKQVLAELPEKTEQTIVCEMEPAQRKVYDDLRQYYRTHLLTQLDTPGTPAPARDSGAFAGGAAATSGGGSFMVLEALLRLRQAACHPGLIDDARADEPSAKLDALMEMLEDVVNEGGKALIFSQFTSMLSLVKRRLDARALRHCYLDGQTRDRRRVVEQFQSDPTIPVFLISLKAGGFGLNLTAAEYVFILDPWWNPAVEAQAIDRTHRIGQTRHVFAYRMICENTVEQRILELQARKRKLADAIVGEQQDLLRSLTRDDLDQLLS